METQKGQTLYDVVIIESSRDPGGNYAVRKKQSAAARKD